MDKFDAKLIALQVRQDAHLAKVGTLLALTRPADLFKARRYHDGLLDPLARALLDALHDRGEHDSYPAQLLTSMVEATCLTIEKDGQDIRKAALAAWEIVTVMDDVDYIYEFTRGGDDEGKFRLVALALETMKAWILVTEAALDRAPPQAKFDVAQASVALRHLTNRYRRGGAE